MAMEWLGSVVSAVLKNAPGPMLAIGIASGLVLFSPDTLIESLGMAAIRVEHKAEIGGAFLLSIAYLSATTMLWLKDVIAKGWKTRSARLVREQRLRELTPAEKSYLAPYVLEHENTRYFEPEDGIAGGLSAKNMLYRSSNVFNMLQGVPFNIQPWCRDYLTAHPELLEGAAPPLQTGRRRRI
ncbi:hypothetical protein J2Y86_000896 [Pseudomonas migulae]|uniref:superinfection exclusion B family protein n=1 Tax=Pseudomonas migulae TaxID=78543 RepID=UPI00209D9598|nr:superinfection exclusion B family protein [Pseudomonas migulae]MCP1496189.1 hypothetical protein [Pseudomonas migulae]